MILLYTLLPGPVSSTTIYGDYLLRSLLLLIDTEVPEYHYKVIAALVVLELSLRSKGFLSSLDSIKVRKASNYQKTKGTQSLIIILKLIGYLDILDPNNSSKR